MQRRQLDGGGLLLKTTLKTSVVPSRFCKSTTLLIAQATWTPSCVKCDKRVAVAEYPII